MARTYRKQSSALPKIDHLGADDLVTLIKHAEELLAVKREEAKSKFLSEMRIAAEKAGFNFDELVSGKASVRKRKRSDAGVKLAPKYRGPNGETYAGKGPVPKWLKTLERKGVSREKFRVKGA